MSGALGKLAYCGNAVNAVAAPGGAAEADADTRETPRSAEHHTAPRSGLHAGSLSPAPRQGRESLRGRCARSVGRARRAPRAQQAPQARSSARACSRRGNANKKRHCSDTRCRELEFRSWHFSNFSRFSSRDGQFVSGQFQPFFLVAGRWARSARRVLGARTRADGSGANFDGGR